MSTEDTETESPEPKRRGRPRRHDPVEAPVDGVYRNDHVLNKEKGKRYYLLNDEDAAVKRSIGARKVERREGAARPFYDFGSETDSGYSVRGLTLYEMPEKLAAQHDRAVAKESEDRMALMRQQVRQSGGELEYSDNV